MGIKSMIRRAAFNRLTARQLVRPILRLHSFAYEMSGQLGILLSPDGLHPKHRIMRYEEWFKERIEPGWTVADIGSNTGNLPFVLSEKAAFVYGIEIEAKHVQEAVRLRSKPNIKYICADATRTDLSGYRVDCITLSNVLEHIEHRKEFLVSLVKNVAWKNPSQKVLLIRVPMLDREWIALYKREMGVEYRLDKTHFTEYTRTQFEEEMASACIKIASIECRFGEIYATCHA